MISKNYIILLWFIGLGILAMCIQELAPWGSVIAGGISAISAIIIVWIWNNLRQLSKKPFNIKHTTRTGLYKIPQRDNGIIASGDTFQNARDWLNSKETLSLSRGTTYIIGIQFKARVRRHITRVALRFSPSIQNKPTIVQFRDVNQESLSLTGYGEYERGGIERLIVYTQPLFASKKKAIDYLAEFNTTAVWKGKLNIFIQLDEQDEYIAELTCEVK